MTQRHLIAIGGNLPTDGLNGENLLQSAVERLEEKLDTSARLSRWFRSEAYPPGSGPDFVNGALAVTAPLEPRAILTALHEVEASFGRERDHRWGPRTVDLDLIATDSEIAPDIPTWQRWHDLPLDRQRLETPAELILPHPRMQDRAFVLVPLMDIAPDWRHPILGRTVAEMHADLTQEERSKVISLPNQACH